MNNMRILFMEASVGRSQIKKARLLAGMTQVQVADAMSVSQPTYQRWETGLASIPKGKLAKLAKVLDISPQRLAGKPAPFDLLGVDKGITDERTYFGEVAIHFSGGSEPLLLPISEAERSNFIGALQGSDPLIGVTSLDNRMVFIRSKAIADVFFSSEAFDDYGPDEYGDQHLGIYPDDAFWKIVEHEADPEYLEGEFSDEEIQEAAARFSISESDIEGLIRDGHIEASEREKVREDVQVKTDQFLARARDVVWQLTGGAKRRASVHEDKVIYEACCTLSLSEEDELLYLAPEGYHRSIFIRLAAIDYVSVPAHKFHEGQVESAAEEMGEALD